jgi:alpha-D-ribose 1-methylphosphonate 5-triphosphate synthase subunit PhnH
MPPLAAFAQGSDAYPDRSATLIVQVESFTGAALALSGPGIDGSTTLAASPLPADFAAQLAANRALFPRGVDVILCASGEVAALPRSVRLKEAA